MKNNKLFFALIALLLAAAASCGFLFIREYMAAREEIAEYTALQESFTTVTTQSPVPVSDETPPPENTDDAAAQPAAYTLPYVEADFAALLSVNPDTVGWLSIPDTVISYPVVQTDDNDRYLHTSFSGGRSKTGAVFADCRNTLIPPDQNIILHGHNMGAGREDMFGTLVHYSDKAYFDAHSRIQFDTAERRYGWWKIFAVINLDVTADTFEHLKRNFADEAEFDAWIGQAKKLSLYETGTHVPDGAQILTLSTCNRDAGYGRNGRMIVLAVNMGEAE